MGFAPRNEWQFLITAGRRDTGEFTEAMVDELMDVMIAWAEARGFGIGSGPNRDVHWDEGSVLAALLQSQFSSASILKIS